MLEPVFAGFELAEVLALEVVALVDGEPDEGLGAVTVVEDMELLVSDGSNFWSASVRRFLVIEGWRAWLLAILAAGTSGESDVFVAVMAWQWITQWRRLLRKDGGSCGGGEGEVYI